MRHTKGKWEINKIGKQTIVKDSSGGDIASCEIIGRSQEENEANAEFIVRACNSHEELLGVLKDLLGWANIKASTNSKTLELNNKCEQAIAKAEGK